MGGGEQGQKPVLLHWLPSETAYRLQNITLHLNKSANSEQRNTHSPAAFPTACTCHNQHSPLYGRCYENAAETPPSVFEPAVLH